MSSLPSRLRQWSEFGYGVEASATMKEAAEEIERLLGELARRLTAPEPNVLEDTDKHGPVYAAIAEVWGERCPDFDAGCYCCKAWAEYDRRNAAPSSGWKWMREQAARLAEDMPIQGHGNLATSPYSAAKQVADEIAAAIRALPPPPAEGEKIVTVYEPFPGAWDDVLGPDKRALPPPPAEGEK